ncbi:MAG: CpaF family protein [Anaerolineales bacterium]|nr:CpaF family protein [Chloroflexota bacterium]MBL6982669.1 CpaF family protein [Anaerolineales bacterium]
MINGNLSALEDRLHRLTSERIQAQGNGSTEAFAKKVRRDTLARVVWKLLQDEGEILPRKTQDGLVSAVVNRILGLGPIEPYLHDPEVTEIMVNAPDEIFIERDGRLEQVQASFRDARHILHVIERIVAPLGRRVDESVPYVDARLPDGSRVNAIIPPLALRAPSLTIRRFSATPFTLRRLVSLDTLDDRMARFIQACVRARLNMLISGGTGSGKTSTLNAMARCIPNNERMITIEDTAELQLIAKNLVSLEARPQNIEGKGEVTIRTLVRNALRMRPDRIIVGEVRGAEAFDMLQAMNTGHPGSLTTVHANSPEDAIRRLESMILMASLELPQPAIREQIASAIDIVLQQERLPGGRRKIISIAEVVRKEGSSWGELQVKVQEIFRFERQGVDDEGRALGVYQSTGYQPQSLETIRKAGITLQAELDE